MIRLLYSFNQLSGYKIPIPFKLRHSSTPYTCRTSVYPHACTKKPPVRLYLSTKDTAVRLSLMHWPELGWTNAIKTTTQVTGNKNMHVCMMAHICLNSGSKHMCRHWHHYGVITLQYKVLIIKFSYIFIYI